MQTWREGHWASHESCSQNIQISVCAPGTGRLYHINHHNGRISVILSVVRSDPKLFLYDPLLDNNSIDWHPMRCFFFHYIQSWQSLCCRFRQELYLESKEFGELLNYQKWRNICSKSSRHLKFYCFLLHEYSGFGLGICSSLLWFVIYGANGFEGNTYGVAAGLIHV